MGSIGSLKEMSKEEADNDSALLAVSPIDGRYRGRTRALERFFSEFALIRYRVKVEVEWYLSLAANPAIDAVAPLAPDLAKRLRAIYEDFTLADANRVKALERAVNHDVKAVEYFVKERMAAAEPSLALEMVHFACTSEDINSIAYALILKEFVTRDLIPRLHKTVATVAAMAQRLREVAMLSLTHGQAATPTTAGKEMAIFAARLERQLRQLEKQEYLGKANGAVGNFNAHQFAYPEVDWIAHSKAFVESLGLVWAPLTTQIESHDFMAELFDVTVRINTILIDFSRDMWGYISRAYFTQRPVPGEVGSSTMPHKINPIDFENCEGNLGIASALLQHLAVKLPVSRFQRDLSDSTALRSIGSAVRARGDRAQRAGTRTRAGRDQSQANRRRVGPGAVVGGGQRSHSNADAPPRPAPSLRNAEGTDPRADYVAPGYRGVRGAVALERGGQAAAARVDS